MGSQLHLSDELELLGTLDNASDSLESEGKSWDLVTVRTSVAQPVPSAE